MPAWLAVESGLVLQGRSVGAEGERTGDLVFNTAMSGYPEILTDPSYCGQVVVMTYPLIGNYGMCDADAESDRAWPEAFVMREMSSIASSHRADASLPAWLESRGVVAIDGIDTRQLTKHIREHGSLRCVVSTTDGDANSLVAKARAAASTDGRDLASLVSTKTPYVWNEGYQESFPAIVPGLLRERRVRLVAYDLGIKRNILRSLVHAGFDVTVVPAGTPAADVLGMDPEGVFLSNGPGDPAAVQPNIAAVSDLVGKVPIFGICLGHQILSIVLGAKTHKMPFGHHGANHPVRDLDTKRVEITSQNHSFAVDPATLPAGVELTHVNLNDGTVEGMRHQKARVSCVQYHPEAAPGPVDSSHLFRRFATLVRG
ncbi:MAG: glutamine-hydrolyzing carbamoyl-phosphate synthase small subunit [Planctomycetaceae bacterium]|nr:glutamine-hydrolyzing carbamoyl-phosphate synthase small subunit [Planctomycetaceae bacterium]